MASLLWRSVMTANLLDRWYNSLGPIPSITGLGNLLLKELNSSAREFISTASDKVSEYSLLKSFITYLTTFFLNKFLSSIFFSSKVSVNVKFTTASSCTTSHYITHKFWYSWDIFGFWFFCFF
ncbi:Protein of unknown function [Cotesia congregata]|uniref:Uncharacterized protein n=1 Tax=Cotesia congregata TaxID=51543 RepID=A0A8J2E260_COTCN|nr:Protein of unknown function [Cotesia congregata]